MTNEIEKGPTTEQPALTEDEKRKAQLRYQAMAKTMPDVVQSIDKIATQIMGKPHAVMVIIWRDGVAQFAMNATLDDTLQAMRDVYAQMKSQHPQPERRIIVPGAGANDGKMDS